MSSNAACQIRVRVPSYVGVRNVVSTLQREVVVGKAATEPYARSVRFEDSLKLYPDIVG